jgi:ribonuclease HII
MIELIKLSNNKAGLYLIDAEQINIDNYLIKSFIKGDSKYQCIAAASIVAKVEHDRYMQELAKK